MKATCPVCGKSNHSVIYRSSDFNLLMCDECEFVMKSFGKRIDRQEVQNLQDSVYASLNRINVGIAKKLANDRLKLLTQFRKTGNLIEIGCATGEFLEAANDYGFNVTGIDASERYAYYAHQRGLNVKHGRLEDITFDRCLFDVVAIFHLFEHIEDPNRFLRVLANVITDDGLLMIVVPNLASFTDAILGLSHPVFHQPDHLFFYTKSTLLKILNNNGYKMLSIQSKEYPHHPFTSLQSWLANRLSRRRSESGTPMSNRPSANDPNSSNGGNRRGTEEFMKRIVRKTPYALGNFLYLLLRPYGIALESLTRGHEIIALFQKSTIRDGDH